MEIARLVEGIQDVLAPAVMVSSAALLLLGFQAKFSNLASRFRGLQHDQRVLALKTPKTAAEEERLKSLKKQVEHLMRRAACVKWAIVLAYLAIACFMSSSILIFLNVYASFRLGHGVIALFVTGLLCVLAIAVVMVVETELFHKVLRLERLS